MVVLAISDTMAISMWVTSLSVTIGIGAVMTLWLRSLDSRTRKIESFEVEMRKMARELVTSEIGLQTKALQGSIDRLTDQMVSVRERLRDGEDEFEKLGERSEKINSLLNKQTGEIKDYIRDNFAGKREVELLISRVDSLGNHLHGVEIESVKAAALAASAAAGKKTGS